MATIGKDIDVAVKLLQNNDLVAIPTETVYGLAGNALSETAIKKIFEAKNRPFTDPLIVHVADVNQIPNLVSDFPDLAKQLFEIFSPGPLTILLPKSKQVPDLITNGSAMVAIRIPNHPLTLELLKSIDFPLAAPSANPFGGLSPTVPEHVQSALGSKIQYILDGGPCEVGLESTIIKLTGNSQIEILRQGGISEETLQSFCKLEKENESQKIVVPGSMLSHYAPAKPLFINDIESLLSEYKKSEIAFLGFEKYNLEFLPENQMLLSKDGNLNEAARNLFSHLHQLDLLAVKAIFCDKIPEIGIGKAINDRLKRAAAKRK
jgi:L-threonylcarbamoyladenylate synthase